MRRITHTGRASEQAGAQGSSASSGQDEDAPKVVHYKRAPQNSFVYIGRPSLFGNPFRLANLADDRQRDQVIARYAAYFHARITKDPAFRQAVETLRGR